MGRTEKAAVTSGVCMWKESRKEVKPAPLSEIKFHKAKRLRKQFPAASKTTHKNSGTPRVLTDDDIQELLAVDPDCAVLTSLDNSDTDTASSDDNEEEHLDLPEPLTALFSTSSRDLTPDELKVKCEETFHLLKTKLKPYQCKRLEAVTRQQSHSREWNIHRAGRITSTKFHRATTSDMISNTYLMDVLQYNNRDLHVPFVLWGQNMEETARQAYTDVMAKTHVDLTVSCCGLVVLPSEPHLGSSPDGVVSCKCCGKGVVEIKCPYKYQQNFNGCTDDSKFCLDKSLTLKQSHPYYHQIQLHMFVCDVKYCDFVLWSKQQLILQRVLKNLAFLQETLPKAQNVFISVLLPELLTRRHDPAFDSEKTCKVCERPEYGKMISCVKCNNYFHYSCANIKRKPATWFCGECQRFLA